MCAGLVVFTLCAFLPPTKSNFVNVTVKMQIHPGNMACPIDYAWPLSAARVNILLVNKSTKSRTRISFDKNGSFKRILANGEYRIILASPLPSYITLFNKKYKMSLQLPKDSSSFVVSKGAAAASFNKVIYMGCKQRIAS
jgi:hypothetical protein